MDFVLENKQPELYLEFCSQTDPRRQKILLTHYVVSRGTHGQQLHFLIRYNGKLVGTISGGSAVFASASRDNFFRITKENRTKVLNGIVDNLLFHLDYHEKNLATRCVSLWRKVTAYLWKDLYGVDIFGFETFIDEIRAGGGTRDGALYKADNWSYCGVTAGNTKHHGNEGLTGGLVGKPFQRRIVPKKLVFCRWHAGFNAPQEFSYKSSWKCSTPEEKELAKTRSQKRQSYLGKKFYSIGKSIFTQNGEQPWIKL